MVTLERDNRFFARTHMGGKEVLALLDSGEWASCLEKNASKLLREKEDRIMPIKGQSIKTANGGQTSITRAFGMSAVSRGMRESMNNAVATELVPAEDDLSLKRCSMS